MEQQVHTFESVWATLENAGAKIDRLAERQAETESDWAETKRILKDLAKEVGGMSKNNGIIAEEYFFNSFQKGKTNFFGEKFDEIKKNRVGLKTDDEFDIVMLNGNAVGIVEVKHKAHENDLPAIIRKAETFRINFPDYQQHKVYLGLASMAFYPKLEQECINRGIAVIKQSGDNVVINDKHLKVY